MHVCVFVCELGTRCKIAPWLQSKSMQSKQEMATIEETEGGGRRKEGGEGGRRGDRWRVGQSVRGREGKMSSWQ